MNRRFSGICLLVLTLSLVLPAAGCAEAPWQDAGIDLGGSSVHYLHVIGMEDKELEETINARIGEALGLEQWLNTAPLLMSAPTKLSTAYQVYTQGDVLSMRLTASGNLGEGRQGEETRCVTIDLRSGELIALTDFFTDTDAAGTLLTQEAEEAQAEANPMLSASEYLPLPEQWTVSESGITFFYPSEQVCTLLEHGGTLLVPWHRLEGALDLSEDSLIRRIDGAQTLYLTAESPERIRESASSGSLPGIPAKLGDAVASLAESWGERQDPDLYEGGRMLQLEGDAFRGVWLLTDDLHEDWTDSVVQGIRSDRLSLWGLVPGVTSQADWRAYLGEPDRTAAIDRERADSWRIEPGESDYYQAGDYLLRLHADETGTLRQIFLIQ